MNYWPNARLGEIVDGITVGYVGPMTHEYLPVGVPFLRSLNIEPYRVNRNDLKFVSDTFHRRLSKSALKPGDVVVVRTGKPGTAAVIPADLPEANCSDLVIVRPGARIDPRFLVYYLNSSIGASSIGGQVVGSVQRHFNIGDARSLPVPMPPLHHQQAIATILGALDDKINVNLQLAETLDAAMMATYSRVADQAEVSVPIATVADIRGGSTPSTESPQLWSPATHFWATPKDMNALHSPVLLRTERKISDAGLESISSGLLSQGTVLLSSRAPIGYVAIAAVPVAINQGFIALVPIAQLSSEYLCCWVRASMSAIKALANGTTFMEVSKRSFRELRIAIPPNSLLVELNSSAKPGFQLMVSLELQNDLLSTLRDLLLPRLMSGEIGVPEAERAIGSVV